MQSGIVDVHLTANNTVCDVGFVLALDAADTDTTSEARAGQCTECKPGTYSLNPLKQGADG